MDLLLVEDHTVFRQAMAFFLAREPDLRVVGQAGSLAEARQVLEQVGALNMALIDLGLPDGDGCTLIATVRSMFPECAVVVLTASAEWRDRARAIQAGAAGVLHKSAPLEEMLKDVRRVLSGDTLLTPTELVELLQRMTADRVRQQQHGAPSHLTTREHEVLQALADGLSDKEIAVRLTVSTETVHKHIGNILGKTGVDSRLQALLYGLRNGMVTVH